MFIFSKWIVRELNFFSNKKKVLTSSFYLSKHVIQKKPHIQNK